MIKWVLDRVEEAEDNLSMDDKHPCLKAFCLGGVKGFVDAACLLYVPLLIATYYWKGKALKK